MSLRCLRNNRDVSRFGFVVPNTISKKSTQRNLYRRKLRALISANLNRIKPGFDVILKIERPGEINRLEGEIHVLLEKGQLLI